MKRALTPILITAAILLASGCSTLDNATKVESKFPAEAYTAKLEFDGRFEVLGINGRPEESRKLQQQMKLVPGTHEIEVLAKEYRLEGMGVIPLTVADGQILELTTQRDGAKLVVNVWDITDGSGEPVKLSSHQMEIQAAAYTNLANRTSNETNGNRPLGR